MQQHTSRRDLKQAHKAGMDHDMRRSDRKGWRYQEHLSLYLPLDLSDCQHILVSCIYILIESQYEKGSGREYRRGWMAMRREMKCRCR